MIQLCLVLITSITVFGRSNSVEIWIRAFTPDPPNAGGGSGYIRQIPNGGSSVSLHDIDASLPNLCFSTDYRGFSNNSNATCKLETNVFFTLNEDGTGRVTFDSQRTSASSMAKKVDCTTGDVSEQRMGSVDRNNIGTPAVADSVVQVERRNLLTPFRKFRSVN